MTGEQAAALTGPARIDPFARLKKMAPDRGNRKHRAGEQPTHHSR